MSALTRRSFWTLATALLPSVALSRMAGAASSIDHLAIGFQKVGLLVVARQRRVIEGRLKSRAVEVDWSEFTSGPPLMEAINAGSIDFGYAGDTPPIFAQAAGTPFVYIAAIPPSPAAEAIIVKDSSPIGSLADLKGRRIGFTKASSSHNLTVAALEKAGIAYDEITPVYLAPADAAAAFATDAIDAWTIWDPFLAVAEKSTPTRTLARSGDLLHAYPFVLAREEVATAHPELVRDVLDALKEAAHWAETHRDELARTLAEITGVDLDAQRVAAERTSFGVVPLDEAIIAAQQATADRFYQLHLIPESIKINDKVWVA